jgi:MoaA/NifB/PqqE/SkfB family radical SAM enzyme
MAGPDLQRAGAPAPLPLSFDFAFYPNVPEISLELTNICNLKCPYCANPALTRPKGRIEWSLFERIVAECGREGYDLAWLHGTGEPLLWDRLEDAVRLIKQHRAGRGSFATNGTLLYADRVRKLLDVGLDYIYISLDSLDPQIYKATRGGKLAKVVENIQTLLKLVPRDFKVVIALMNHRDQTIGDRERARFRELFGERENVQCTIIQNALVPSAPVDLRAVPAKQDGCVIPSKTLFINKDGVAALCCTDQDSLHPLGDVTKQTIKEIWFSPANQVMFRNIALGVYQCPELCQRCVLNPPRGGPDAMMASSIGMSLPIDEVKDLLQQALDAGNTAVASELLTAVVTRNPYDMHAAHMWSVLANLSRPEPAPVL